MVEKSDKMPWYSGKTFLESLDDLRMPKRPTQIPLRIPIQDCYKIQGIGTVPAGRVESGILKPGMKVTFGPIGLTSEVKSIEMHHDALQEAMPGDNVGFCVKGVPASEIKRGYVASDANNDPCKDTAWFRAQIVVMNHPG